MVSEPACAQLLSALLVNMLHLLPLFLILGLVDLSAISCRSPRFMRWAWWLLLMSLVLPEFTIFKSNNLPSFLSAAPLPHELQQQVLMLPASITGLWISVSVLLLLASLIRYFRWRKRLMNTAMQPPVLMRRKATQLTRLCGLSSTPRLCLSPMVSNPMLIGCFRPIIILPVTLCTAPSHRAVSLAILHEMLHLRQRDHIAQFVAFLICCACWFNPLVWWAASRSRAWMERACDGALVKYFPRQRACYRNLILDQLAGAHFIAPVPVQSSTAVLSMGLMGASDLHRYHLLAESIKPLWWHYFVFTIVMVFIFVANALTLPEHSAGWLRTQQYSAMPGSLMKQYWLQAQLYEKNANREGNE